ncbi:MAG: TIGR03621 family F420-dependent LLM class oxidoreductase [Chloroflexi bacterium]|nr:TIGR03621 family F420-dependent LLM class oxidoreductase [Chloroflexota bacterium]MDA1147052.1 TIGR03621 family F420-dependent LLM class oxidoreductase [Chloroflexota bacterium]
MHPFRFGLSARGLEGPAEWTSLARRVESLGYDTLSVADHLVDGLLPPFVALATAAAATERIRLGTLVLNNDLRHPVMTAREAAALDVLSGGRVELGLGAGHSKPEYEAIGLPFDDASTRVERLEESAAIVSRLLRGETVNFEGAHYQVLAHQLWPRPAQEKLPLLIGGNGPRLLRLAAREADIVGFTGMGRTLEDGQRHEPTGFGPTAVDQRVALVRSAAGERSARLEFQALVQSVVITDDRQGAAAAMVGELSPLSGADILGSPFLLIGTPDELSEELRGHRERFGISYYTVFEKDLEALAPVVQALTGT